MKRFFYGALWVLLILGLLVFNGRIVNAPNPEVVPLQAPKTDQLIEVELQWCVDGDTAYFMHHDEKIKVRFLGIDAPELKDKEGQEEAYAKEAANKACTLLENAKVIRLEFESDEKSDKYDRTLAWVWADNTLIQKELVYEGLVDVKYMYGEYLYKDELLKVLQDAKVNKRGMWSK